MPITSGNGIWTVIGSLIVASGLALAGVSAFDDNLFPTFVGFLVFFGGYRISQRDVRDTKDDNAEMSIRDLRQRITGVFASRVALVLLGGFLASYGVTLFAATMINPDPVRVILAGVSCICGYMSTHTGINGTLL